MTDDLASAVGELEGTIHVLDMKLAELQKKHSLVGLDEVRDLVQYNLRSICQKLKGLTD